jgi:hypothetical protein
MGGMNEIWGLVTEWFSTNSIGAKDVKILGFTISQCHHMGNTAAMLFLSFGISTSINAGAQHWHMAGMLNSRFIRPLTSPAKRVLELDRLLVSFLVIG